MPLKIKYKYIITSGWWSIGDDKLDTREILRGDSYIRDRDFHQEWFRVVNRYTNAKKIYIIDSNSPIKPILNKEKEILVELINNAGHSTNHIGKLSGVSRAHILGMSLAMVNEEIDYWVYIEQDALIYGENIIEKAIENMKKPYMFGYGLGTPQPVQQSFMIIKREYILDFINRFYAITSTDNEISPEVKFAIASSKLLSFIPEFFYKQMETNNIIKHIMWTIIKYFRGFDYIPFGYGRVRPIDFSKSHFYFQHATKKELKCFLKKFKDI